MTKNEAFEKWMKRNFGDYYDNPEDTSGYTLQHMQDCFEAGQQNLNLEDILNGKVKAYCKGCGSTESLNEIKSKGFLSCCPDRFLIVGEENNDKE